MYRGNELLYALRELLSKEWAGTHIFFMGDEKLIPKDTDNETLKILYSHTVQKGYPEDAFDTVVETYKNVSGLFKAAEVEVRKEIANYLEDLKSTLFTVTNEYWIDETNPFEGLFLRDGQDFSYTINHTKRVCYSFEKTKILYLDGTVNEHSDPLPLLMSYGNIPEIGSWVGDIIGVSDEMPEGYELLDSIYLDW